MKRSIQEYVELAIFGLIAAFLATAFIWLAGWVVIGLGKLLLLLSQLLWLILKFILPVALLLIAGYVIYRVVVSRRNSQPQAAPATVVSSNSTKADASKDESAKDEESSKDGESKDS